MAELKLIQLNVEGDRHWDRIIPFIERELPDVLCLQEVFDRDAEMIAQRFGYHYLHIPTVKEQYGPEADEKFFDEGRALFAKFPLANTKKAYYYKAAPELGTYRGDMSDKRSLINAAIVWGDVEKDGILFTIASTHFTWTPDGKPDGNQDTDLESLLKILDTIPTLVLCGDFNVPRGDDNRIYRALAGRYKDNIPQEIKTTLDTALHRKKNDPAESAKLAAFVVDYIFSTPEYAVGDVRCKFGVSDHCAVIVTVAREK